MTAKKIVPCIYPHRKKKSINSSHLQSNLHLGDQQNPLYTTQDSANSASLTSLLVSRFPGTGARRATLRSRRRREEKPIEPDRWLMSAASAPCRCHAACISTAAASPVEEFIKPAPGLFYSSRRASRSPARSEAAVWSVAARLFRE